MFLKKETLPTAGHVLLAEALFHLRKCKSINMFDTNDIFAAEWKLQMLLIIPH